MAELTLNLVLYDKPEIEAKDARNWSRIYFCHVSNFEQTHEVRGLRFSNVGRSLPPTPSARCKDLGRFPRRPRSASSQGAGGNAIRAQPSFSQRSGY